MLHLTFSWQQHSHSLSLSHTHTQTHTHTHTHTHTKPETGRDRPLIAVYVQADLASSVWLIRVTDWLLSNNYQSQTFSHCPALCVRTVCVCVCVCVCVALAITINAGGSGPAVGTRTAEARWVFHAGGAVHTRRRQTRVLHWREEKSMTSTREDVI